MCSRAYHCVHCTHTFIHVRSMSLHSLCTLSQCVVLCVRNALYAWGHVCMRVGGWKHFINVYCATWAAVLVWCMWTRLWCHSLATQFWRQHGDRMVHHLPCIFVEVEGDGLGCAFACTAPVSLSLSLTLTLTLSVTLSHSLSFSFCMCMRVHVCVSVGVMNKLSVMYSYNIGSFICVFFSIHLLAPGPC